MKHSIIKIRGFAILEILVATVILCGIVYAFLAFSQNQGKRVNQENTGKYLAILTNDLFKSTIPNSSCSKNGDYSLTHCVPVSSKFKELMNDNGFNIDTATVKIIVYTTDPYKNTLMLLLKFNGGHYTQTSASIYAQQLFDNLSQDSVSRFSSTTPMDFISSYSVTNDNGTKIQTEGPTLYFYFILRNDYL